MIEHATGARHPITADETEPPWIIDMVQGEAGQSDLRAWMCRTDPTEWYDPELGPFVVLEGPDGQDVVIPRAHLAVLGRGFLAAHVDAARTDRWPR